MKKVIMTMLAISAFSMNAAALSPERSREEARFLTDKMAYELYLTEDQIDDVYEINYDYFRALGPIDSAYNLYDERRYQDLHYVLYNWQWDYFLAREYFLRPAYIYRGGWAFSIYNHYGHTHFFYGVPRVYHHYVGGHYHVHNYYHDRFRMHRRAVKKLPRGEFRGPVARPGMSNGRQNNGYRIESTRRPEVEHRGNNRENTRYRMGNEGSRVNRETNTREQRNTTRPTRSVNANTKSQRVETRSSSSTTRSMRSSNVTRSGREGNNSRRGNRESRGRGGRN